LDSSSDTEFRISPTACPYPAPLPLASFTGLNAATFRFASPPASPFSAAQILLARFHFTVRGLAARSPPVSL